MAQHKKAPRAQVGLRIPEKMHRRVEKAARLHGNSINGEILERLKRSFEIESLFGGPRLVELITTIAHVMRSTGELAAYYETSNIMGQGKWLSSPYAFDQAMKSVAATLEHHRPPGEIVTPKRTIDDVMGLHGSKVDPKEAERMCKILEQLGPIFAQIEAQKKDEEG